LILGAALQIELFLRVPATSLRSKVAAFAPARFHFADPNSEMQPNGSKSFDTYGLIRTHKETLSVATM
jgi:hypothetical protein